MKHSTRKVEHIKESIETLAEKLVSEADKFSHVVDSHYLSEYFAELTDEQNIIKVVYDNVCILLENLVLS